jgi:hypothetical protein
MAGLPGLGDGSNMQVPGASRLRNSVRCFLANGPSDSPRRHLR